MAYKRISPTPVVEGGTGASTLTGVVTGNGTSAMSANAVTQFAVLLGGASNAVANVASVGTSGQVLTSNGAGSNPTFQDAGGSGINSVAVQTFTSSGTYTPTSGMVYCIIEVIGGGGGGGGTSTTGASTISVAGGGGGGGYARAYSDAATIGASQTVTIGAGGAAGAVGGGNGGGGGTTSVGSIAVATGGGGGGGSPAQAWIIRTGGSGGIGTTGDVISKGDMGIPGCGLNNTGVTFNTMGGGGGGTAFGGGPGGGNGSLATAGTAGSNYGSGGSGATLGVSQTQLAGGAGAAGVVIITEFIA